MRVLLTLMLLLAAPLAFAADPLSIPAITLGTNAAGAQEYSVSLQILLIMTALSFIPAFVMLMTSFTRIIIVFSILRQALGLQQTPSNQILTGMALFLTLFIMAPVFDKVNRDALQPYLAEKQRHAGEDLVGRGLLQPQRLTQNRKHDDDPRKAGHQHHERRDKTQGGHDQQDLQADRILLLPVGAGAQGDCRDRQRVGRQGDRREQGQQQCDS